MIGRWHVALQRWREARTLRRRAIPDVLWSRTLVRFPFLDRLDSADAARLRDLATLFLSRKEFHGVGGLEVTDDMAVAVAAQACLPLLHLGGVEWYDGFVGIVMHPGEVIARRQVTDDVGVVHDYDEALTGEAMEGGPMTLSWQDVADAGNTAEWGYNVVIHEFAHVIDLRDGIADGVPPLPSRAERDAWKLVLDQSYHRFCDQVDAGEATLLDPYGAQSPDEFFAVACETFFVAPRDLQTADPSLYQQLRGFFRQDPAVRS